MIENHGEAELEQASIELLEDLKWDHINAFTETFPDSFLGRENQEQVLLIQRLRPALERLNPELPPEALDQAIDILGRPRHTMSPVAANQDVYDLIKEGVQVEIRDVDGNNRTERVTVIDWAEPDNNDLLVVSQLKISGELYNRRTDLICFVNGIPLVMIEFKAPHVNVKDAYDDNLRDYKDAIPQLFWFNALIILSSGVATKVGSITSEWEHFADWKRVASEDEAPVSSIENALRGTCEASRLLDLVENFVLFKEVTGGTIKIVGKNHQYLGVNNAIDALAKVGHNPGKLGVFWHTQGSGKSISMIFFAQKVLRKVPGNWSFVVVTDRIDLDDQIYKNFVSTGAITEEEAHADTGEELKQLLTEDHRYVFTLIHKFGTKTGQPYPALTDRSDIIVMVDEAHRTQYDALATNMRTALPNANFIAFTGTPLLAGEERTRQEFGDYVSVYDFQQSVIDDNTVPLYYENRIPELQLINEDFTEELEEILERAALDEAEEQRFARDFAREYHLITRDDRLETIASDIVDHFVERGQQGKAMVVSVDKATAIKMHDNVHAAMQRKIESLERDLRRASEEGKEGLAEQLSLAAGTDMAVVVSQQQNEQADLAVKGADITPHRQRMNREDLETKFKDADDPLRIVFITAMWMTGFDVPSLTTMYLDKPMRNHTLMQTIARANRVYPGKKSGEIIDYIGVFRDLQRALAIYAMGPGGTELPVADKEAQAEELAQAVDKVRTFIAEHGVDLASLIGVSKFDWLIALEDARDALVVNDEVKNAYLHLAAEAGRLWRALKPHPAATASSEEMWAIVRLAQAVRSLAGPVDVSTVIDEVEVLLERSIGAVPYVIDTSEEQRLDLSEIDFAALAEKFRQRKKNTAAQQLRGALERKVDELVRLNPTRVDYVQKLKEMIDAYNAGSANIEEFFAQLKLLAEELTDEEQRAVAESLTEEELALFDLLTKPDPELTKAQEADVKKVARELLTKLKSELLVLDWKKRQQTRAAVQVAIERKLDSLPEIYDLDIYKKKCAKVFEHVFEAYQGDGRSIYEAAA